MFVPASASTSEKSTTEKTSTAMRRAIALTPCVASALFVPRAVPSRKLTGKIMAGLIYSPLCRRVTVKPEKISSTITMQNHNHSAENHFSTDGEDTSSADDNNIHSITKRKNSSARAGGRRSRSTNYRKSKHPPPNELVSTVRRWALPLLLLTLILKLILGMVFGGAHNPDVVYYSRSVYQSTTYTRDGNLETTRRENFQSNIPELVKQSSGSVRDSRDFFDIIDKDIEDEIDSLLFQKW